MKNQKTILLVDDDVDFLFQMKLQLERFGFKVFTADSQREAEEFIKTFKPDLAIFDLMMENEDSGFILCYKMKRLYPDVPIVLATAVSAETGILFGLDSDEEKRWIIADLYLEKGIRPDQLQREIYKLLKL
ncbi:MAG: response regulator [Tenuifilaceae bacterium]|jgi:CheY-like chemotaxis protein|nr:response regulator [Bacteroidales bacterium]MDI9516375.1 response regulator [Bacteroidota bacterium]NLH57474.1 response regulator [Rikenellaceae bacterium]OQC62902.1 MAG: Transcriptional regulatory protein YycF [Bacteroidetes bacterium ADurb.Bin008]HNV82227.1 response regulator [Tenuifilaceae bacterium]